MDIPAEQQRFLTTDQAAHYLNIPANTLYHWRYTGRGPAYIRANPESRRNVVRYDRRALDAWLAEHTVTPGEL